MKSHLFLWLANLLSGHQESQVCALGRFHMLAVHQAAAGVADGLMYRSCRNRHGNLALSGFGRVP